MTFSETASQLLNDLVGSYRTLEARKNEKADLLIMLGSFFDGPTSTIVYRGAQAMGEGGFLDALKGAVTLLRSEGSGEAGSKVSTARSIDDLVEYRKMLFEDLTKHPEACDHWSTFETRSYEGIIDILVSKDDLRLGVCSHALADDPLSYHAFTLDAAINTARFQFDQLRAPRITAAKERRPIIPLFAART